MIKKSTPILILALALMPIIACQQPSRIEDLNKQSHKYQTAVRWANLEGAVSYIDPAQQKTIFPELDQWIRENKTVDFKVLKVGMHPSNIKAELLVELSYYEIAYETLKQKRQVQTWAYHAAQKAWLLEHIETL